MRSVKSFLYQGSNVLLATEDDLGHVLDLEGGVGTLTSQISGSSGLVVVDGVALEAGLDREVSLDSGETGLCRRGCGLHYEN